MSFKLGDRVQQTRPIDGKLGCVGSCGDVINIVVQSGREYYLVRFDSGASYWTTTDNLAPEDLRTKTARTYGEFVRKQEALRSEA